jgi:hypothetical protein
LVSKQHLDFELKRHFRERGRLAKELPVYVACCERASNSMRLCVNELGERAKREGKKPPPGRRPRTTTTEVWSAHVCLKFQEDAGESQLLYSDWERRDFERELGTRVEI